MTISYEKGKMKVQHDTGVVDYYTDDKLETLRQRNQTEIDSLNEYEKELMSMIVSCQVSATPM